MKADSLIFSLGQPCLALLSFFFALIPLTAHAQTTLPTTTPSTLPTSDPAHTTSATSQPTTSPSTKPATAPSTPARAAEPFKGRTVEAVRIVGNTAVSNAVIRNLIRTREGDNFDPATAVEDAQRVYGLRKFVNVEPRVEATATGVIVVFIVTEQKQINTSTLQGNTEIDTVTIQDAVDVKHGEAIDRFRVNSPGRPSNPLPRKQLPLRPRHRSRRRPRHRRRDFQHRQGPDVRIRNVTFLGNKSFTADKLKDQVKTRPWIWIFRARHVDPTKSRTTSPRSADSTSTASSTSASAERSSSARPDRSSCQLRHRRRRPLQDRPGLVPRQQHRRRGRAPQEPQAHRRPLLRRRHPPPRCPRHRPLL